MWNNPTVLIQFNFSVKVVLKDQVNGSTYQKVPLTSVPIIERALLLSFFATENDAYTEIPAKT